VCTIFSSSWLQEVHLFDPWGAVSAYAGVKTTALAYQRQSVDQVLVMRTKSFAVFVFVRPNNDSCRIAQ
jgi:hypothetical protein